MTTWLSKRWLLCWWEDGWDDLEGLVQLSFWWCDSYQMGVMVNQTSIGGTPVLFILGLFYWYLYIFFGFVLHLWCSACVPQKLFVSHMKQAAKGLWKDGANPMSASTFLCLCGNPAIFHRLWLLVNFIYLNMAKDMTSWCYAVMSVSQEK